MANVSKEWAREFAILSSRVAEQIMLAKELREYVHMVEMFPAKFTARDIHEGVEKFLDRSAARFGEFLVSDDMEIFTQMAIEDFNGREEVEP